MQNVTVFSSDSDVIRKFLHYLKARRYKNVNINYSLKEITAERQRLLFKTDKFYFKIIFVSQTLTTIEIKVNSLNGDALPYDLQKEAELAEKIYFYI